MLLHIYIVEAGGLFPAGESSSLLVARVVDILPAGGTHSDNHPDIPRAGAHQHLRYQNIQRSDATSQYRISYWLLRFQFTINQNIDSNPQIVIYQDQINCEYCPPSPAFCLISTPVLQHLSWTSEPNSKKR